jgi:hypothetical protein
MVTIPGSAAPNPKQYTGNANFSKNSNNLIKIKNKSDPVLLKKNNVKQCRES